MSGPVVGIWHPGLSSNHGDRAIQRATVDLVLERWPTAQVVQYHRDPGEGAVAYPDRRVSFQALGPFGLPPLGARLAELDFLLWGGGSLIQQSSLLYFPLHLMPAVAAARRGVKVVCFGSGVEPLRSKLLRGLSRRAFDTVFLDGFVRGPLSAELLRSYGVETVPRIAVDQAAALHLGDVAAAQALLERLFGADEDGPIVSVSVKPSFIYRGGVLPVSFDPPSPARRVRRSKRQAFEQSFGLLVRHLADDIGARVLLVPMYLDQGDTAACERVADIAGRGGRVRVLRDPPEPEGLKAVFGQMSAHIGVRLHSCILATSAGIPTVGVQYMNKHLEYFRMLGIDEHLIPEDEVDADRLVQAFQRVWKQRNAIRDRLLARNAVLVSDLKATVGEVFDSLETAGKE